MDRAVHTGVRRILNALRTNVKISKERVEYLSATLHRAIYFLRNRNSSKRECGERLERVCLVARAYCAAKDDLREAELRLKRFSESHHLAAPSEGKPAEETREYSGASRNSA